MWDDGWATMRNAATLFRAPVVRQAARQAKSRNPFNSLASIHLQLLVPKKDGAIKHKHVIAFSLTTFITRRGDCKREAELNMWSIEFRYFSLLNSN
jgi:hypothetical protein